MRRAIPAALVAVLLIVSPVAAAKPVFQPWSVAVDPASDLHWSGFWRFDVTEGSKLKGYEYPMVLVRCDTGHVFLEHPDVDIVPSLWGGWEAFIGTSADCTAQVWAYVTLNHTGE